MRNLSSLHFLPAFVALLASVSAPLFAQEPFVKARLSGDFPAGNRSVAEVRELPGGDKVLYTTVSENMAAVELFSARIDGGGVTRIDELGFAGYSAGFIDKVEISSDGGWLAYNPPIGGPLIVSRADATERLVFDLPGLVVVTICGFSSDGGFLIATFQDPDTYAWSVWRFPLTGERTPVRLFLSSPENVNRSADVIAGGTQIALFETAGANLPTINLRTMDIGGSPGSAVEIAGASNFHQLGDRAALVRSGLDMVRVDYGAAGGLASLTTLPQAYSEATFSPSGDKIFYRSANGYLVSSPGGVFVDLPYAGPEFFAARLSPDESRLVGWATGFPSGLVSVNLADGSFAMIGEDGVTTIQGYFPGEDSIRISPDGQKVVAAGNEQGASAAEVQLFSMPIDGGLIHKLGTSPAGSSSSGRFEILSDSTSVISIGEEKLDVASRLVFSPIDGGAGVSLLDDFVAGGDVDQLLLLADGDGVLFVADSLTNSLDELFFLELPPVLMGAAVKISRHEASRASSLIEDVATSRDGKWVAYLAAQDTPGVVELYVASVDGSVRNRVNPPLAALRDVKAFAFSNDSTRIFYTADQDTNRVRDLYVAALDGSDVTRMSAGLGAGFEVDRFVESPDGGTIAAVVEGVNEGEFESKLWLFDAVGLGAPEKIDHPGHFAHGKRMTFSSDSRYVAWLTNSAELSGPALLDLQSADRSPVVFDGIGGTSRIRFTPDSGHLVFDREFDDGPRSIESVRIEDGTMTQLGVPSVSYSKKVVISADSRWALLDTVAGSASLFQLVGLKDPALAEGATVAGPGFGQGGFSPDVSCVVLSGSEGLKVLSLEAILSGGTASVAYHTAQAFPLAISPGGSLGAAVLFPSRALGLFDLSAQVSSELLAPYLGPGYSFQLFFSRDSSGVFVVSVSPEGLSRLRHFRASDGDETSLSTGSGSGWLTGPSFLQQNTRDWIVFARAEASAAEHELFSVRFDRDATIIFNGGSPEADPDGDRLSNLIEFFFGTDPENANASDQQQVSVQSIVGERFASLAFPRRSKAELEVTVEHSTDLAHWVAIASSVGNGRVIVPLQGRAVVSGSADEVEVRSTISLEESPRQHFRIRVSLPAGS